MVSGTAVLGCIAVKSMQTFGHEAALVNLGSMQVCGDAAGPIGAKISDMRDEAGVRLSDASEGRGAARRCAAACGLEPARG